MDRPQLPAFPPCAKCAKPMELVTTMMPLEDGAEIYLVECPKCRTVEMYLFNHGYLRRI